MFIIAPKPRFYSYPLTTQEFTRVQLRQQDLLTELATLQREVHQTTTATEYSLPDAASSHKYASYRQRLQDKIRILQEELTEYQQIAQLHQQIDDSLKQDRSHRPEVRHRMLEQYQKQMMEKRGKKTMVRFKKIEGAKEEEVGKSEANRERAAGVAKSELYRDKLGQSPLFPIQPRAARPYQLMQRNRSGLRGNKSCANPENSRSRKSEDLRLPSLWDR